MNLDNLDQQLIALLQHNARDSTAELARQLGVARTTVLARLQRLERQGVIVGYTVRLAQPQDGGVEAFVGITSDSKSAAKTIARLAALPGLRQLCSVSGEFDYIALLHASTPAQLDALLNEMGAIPGVVRTTTSMVLARQVNRVA